MKELCFVSMKVAARMAWEVVKLVRTKIANKVQDAKPTESATKQPSWWVAYYPKYDVYPARTKAANNRKLVNNRVSVRSYLSIALAFG